MVSRAAGPTYPMYVNERLDHLGIVGVSAARLDWPSGWMCKMSTATSG
jgi:hypothetical protein